MRRALWLGLFASVLAGCVTYGGISKTADGKVYITGSTSFIVFTSSFVKRCTESGTTLTCDQLTVTDVAAGKADASSDDEDEKPKKKKKKKPEDE